MQPGTERRKASRTKKLLPSTLRIAYEERAGEPKREILATLLDTSQAGCRIGSGQPLVVGSLVFLNRDAIQSLGKSEACSARVTWCTVDGAGGYCAGLHFNPPEQTPPRNSKSAASPGEAVVTDYYDTLQLSPKADPDMIHRVYRLLAQRFHPDNPDTGNAELFRQLLEAYRVLSDPEQRASYDIKQGKQTGRRWQIFDRSNVLRGRGDEQRKRQGILSVLYTRRINEPGQPAVTIPEMEDLLGCPREHLEFSLWFLKEKGFILRGDNGRFSITLSGAEEAEFAETPSARRDRLLENT